MYPEWEDESFLDCEDYWYKDHQELEDDEENELEDE